MNKSLVLLTLILLVGSVSASLTYQKDTVVDITASCEINGNACSSSAYCNITTKYPNGSYAVENKVMTYRDGGDFNYTLPDSSILGEYTNKVICSEAGLNDTGISTFEITQSGSNLSTSQGIVYIIFFLGAMFVFFLTLYGAIKIPWGNRRNEDGKIVSVNDLKYVKVFLMVMVYIILMWIFAMLRTITANFLYLDSASRLFNWMFWIMLSFLWPLIVCSLIFTLVLFIEGKRIKKALRRGLPIR